MKKKKQLRRFEYVKGMSGSTGLFEMIVGVLTTCHKQYT